MTASHMAASRMTAPKTAPKPAPMTAPKTASRMTETHMMIEAAERSSLDRDFPLNPFAIKHQLAGNPLFTLPRIIELLRALPRDQIESNSGQVEIGQDPNKMPLLDMEPDEIVRRLETASAWMVLKRVETDPAYKKVLEDALLAVARQKGHASVREAGFHDIRGFMFVSSPKSTTPFHIDGEDNIFVQIHGEKFFTIFDNRDGSIASPDAVEHCITQHRNLAYDKAFDAKSVCHRLLPGDGVFVPYLWPHWVRTSDSYSVSLAITWKTRDVIRNNDLLVCNSMLRRVGLPQPAPGRYPLLDRAKSGSLAMARSIVEPLRKLEAIRIVLRRIALGRNANYYLKTGAKPAG